MEIINEGRRNQRGVNRDGRAQIQRITYTALSHPLPESKKKLRTDTVEQEKNFLFSIPSSQKYSFNLLKVYSKENKLPLTFSRDPKTCKGKPPISCAREKKKKKRKTA